MVTWTNDQRRKAGNRATRRKLCVYLKCMAFYSYESVDTKERLHSQENGEENKSSRSFLLIQFLERARRLLVSHLLRVRRSVNCGYIYGPYLSWPRYKFTVLEGWLSTRSLCSLDAYVSNNLYIFSGPKSSGCLLVHLRSLPSHGQDQYSILLFFLLFSCFDTLARSTNFRRSGVRAFQVGKASLESQTDA